MPPSEQPRDPALILKDIRAKTNMIGLQRHRQRTGEFKSMGAAMALQKLLRERKLLQGELPPLRLITE
jgi:hypothetical protein